MLHSLSAQPMGTESAQNQAFFNLLCGGFTSSHCKLRSRRFRLTPRQLKGDMPRMKGEMPQIKRTKDRQVLY